MPQIWINRNFQNWFNRFSQSWIDRESPVPEEAEVITKGLSRLAYQFEASEKFRGFIESFLQQYQDLKTSDLQLLNERYLNTAVGVQLDGIGEIVGLSRPTVATAAAGIFGFIDDPTALGFGDINDSDIGGNFLGEGATESLIGDDLYHLLIRAKIMKNQTAMTVDDTLRLISFTFGGIRVRYFPNDFLIPRYDIGRALTSFEAGLLSGFPVLIGIDHVVYHSYDENIPFGFEDDGEAFGFGDLNDTTLGGNFAQII